jgi:hypothetical protein
VCGTDEGGSTESPIFNARVDARLSEEQIAVNDLLESIRNGGAGYVEDKKPPDIVRLLGENVNSLCLYDETHKESKPSRLRQMSKRFQADAALLLETGTDFRQLPEDKRLEQLLGDDDCVVVTANNVTEGSGRSQYGGTAAVNFPRLAGFTIASGADKTGLARWVWTLVGTGERKTRIVTAYRPVKPTYSTLRDRRRGWYTVWAQQVRYFRKKGLPGSPRQRFVSDLVEQLLQWKSEGDEIILFCDFNEHVYEGGIASALDSPELMMTECFQTANGCYAPASHYRGKRPITGCFCTQGIDCINVWVSAPCRGVGDHRFWIMDFCAKSVLGSSYPHLVRPKGRLLKCHVERTVKAYNKRLRRLTDEHRMYGKMETLICGVDTLTPSELGEGMNRWDGQHTEHQRGSENHCNQFMNDDLEFSPETDIWIKRRDLYRQLQSIRQRQKEGVRADVTHFVRSCAVYDIPDPFSLSDEQISDCIEACKVRLIELVPVAPALRQEHLRNLLGDASSRNQPRRHRRILQIMRREHLRRQRQRWQGLKRATKSRRGGAPTRIKVKGGQGDELYETQAEVEDHASRKLTDRFKLARDNPASTGKIFDDIGYLGDTTCSRAILEGTYEFPPDMDPHLRMLFEEAHRVFSLKSTEEISNFVSTEDFQYFWSRADETIQSSYSHIHFGHYKAIARDKYLSALQAAKLSLAAKTGIPMERWGHSLTVLLEKEFGNIYIDKMRAICLMEADFNWLNKLVFAKRMMDQAYDAGIVPVEQFARRGVQSAHGALCKILFCDMMRALHLVAGLPSVDLGNCYDAVAHPIASIALQALKVPLMTVVLALSVMQTMTFYLRTGYGVSQQGYGGTVDDPSMGLGQGNGMAPSGFQSVSTLMINTYRRLGHASEFCGAWSGLLFCLAAIIEI